MPADLTMPERTERHGDAARPYHHPRKRRNGTSI